MTRSHLTWRTRLLLGVLVVQGLVTTGVVVAFLLLLNSSGQLAADRGAKAVTLAGVASENRDEVSRLGGTPIGPDPATVLRGDPGTDGTDGRDGRDGRDGKDGKDGKNATPAQIAAAVAAQLKAHPPRAGRDGRDGADGQSPACLAEVDQCRGADGTDGTDGADGQPPAVWTWTDPDTGVRFECRRDPASPDSAPAYSCTKV